MTLLRMFSSVMRTGENAKSDISNICFLRCFTSSVLCMQTLWVDPYNGLKTHQNDIIFDRGMSFEAACRKLEHEKGAEDASGFRRSRRPIFGRTMFLLAVQKVGTPGVFSICRPNTGTSFFDMEVQLPSCTLQLMCPVSTGVAGNSCVQHILHF